MPNWTQNHTIIKSTDKETIVNLVNKLKTKNNVFDFNKVIPIPEALQHEWRAVVGEFDDEQTKQRKQKMLDDLKEEYGYCSWYEFCVNMWGTKWNSCEASVSKIRKSDDQWFVVYDYQTAWSPPHNLLLELSRQVCNVTIINDACDEGSMYAPFVATYKGGKLISEVEYENEEEEE